MTAYLNSYMTYLPFRRSALVSSCAIALLAVSVLAFAAPVRADNENATSTDGAPGANAGQVVATTSSDGTGGQHDVGGTIDTGAASASTSVENSVNKNDASNVDSACSAEQVAENGGCLNSSGFTATSTNEALVNNFSTSTASTGANVADGGQGTATIVTGGAFAFANVLNLINTNIFNSQGLLLFLNQLFPAGLDLRDYDLGYFFEGQAGNSPTVNEETGEAQCTLLTCPTSSNINVLSGNTATVTNSVIVRADAGGNTASTTDTGDASVTSGDAYAAANVVNLVNTNIVNSSYLLAAFNSFGDLNGDITLPGDDFFRRLFAHEGSAPEMNSSSYSVYNENQLALTGTTTAGADTGSNTASTTGEGSGIVSTGDAYSKATTYTNANNNYVGGTSALFMFRVAGEWRGDVKSLPGALHVKRVYDAATRDGITSTSTLVLVTNEEVDEDNVPVGDQSGAQDPEGAAGANCKEPRPGHPEDEPVNNCFNSSTFVASSTNTAAVENNVDVTANTGHNNAYTEDGVAHVITGDAYAVANVINLINTNIVGRNWIFALFNVLGDWNGDITFGRSDLELEARTTAATVTPGTNVAYYFTITNNGDRDADDITLKAGFDHNQLSFTDTDGVRTDEGREWHIPTVGRGESRTFTYTARVGSIPQGTSVPVPISVSALSDGDTSSAQASFTVALLDVVNPPSSGGSRGGGGRRWRRRRFPPQDGRQARQHAAGARKLQRRAARHGREDGGAHQHDDAQGGRLQSGRDQRKGRRALVRRHARRHALYSGRQHHVPPLVGPPGPRFRRPDNAHVLGRVRGLQHGGNVPQLRDGNGRQVQAGERRAHAAGLRDGYGQYRNGRRGAGRRDRLLARGHAEPLPRHGKPRGRQAPAVPQHPGRVASGHELLRAADLRSRERVPEQVCRRHPGAAGPDAPYGHGRGHDHAENTRPCLHRARGARALRIYRCRVLQ